MSNAIRPLAAFKKQNPAPYEKYIGYLSFEDKMKALEEELKPFYEEVSALKKGHQANIQAAALGNKLLS